MNEKELVYLTEEEIDTIATLHADTIGDYIKDMPERKKQLAMKQYSKERAIRQWKTIANEPKRYKQSQA